MPVGADLPNTDHCRRGRALAELVQVTLSLADPHVRTREVSAMTEALDEEKLDVGLVLTESDREDIVVGKRTIKVRPLAGSAGLTAECKRASTNPGRRSCRARLWAAETRSWLGNPRVSAGRGSPPPARAAFLRRSGHLRERHVDLCALPASTTGPVLRRRKVVRRILLRDRTLTRLRPIAVLAISN
jgi:hypothetical protein